MARDRAARRTTLTGRAAILAAVVAVLAMSLAYPLRQYLSQRSEISRFEEQVHEQERRVAELAAERERWEDPAYIKAQARERLHYCLPRETCYVTVDGDPPAPAPTAGTDGSAAALADAQPTPWFAKLWESVEEAAAPDSPLDPAQDAE